MTPADFRRRLEALLGPVHTAKRAAAALGYDKSHVHRWLRGERDVVTPARHQLEDIEHLIKVLRSLGVDPEPHLPARWRRAFPITEMSSSADARSG